MKVTDEELSAKFLLDASLLYREKCPELSRFLLRQSFQNKKLMNLPGNTFVCHYCYQWLEPGNHTVRLRPKKRPSARVQSILIRRGRGKRLSYIQKQLLLRYQKSSAVLMATCHACSQTTRHQGVNRDFITTFGRSYSTPGSASSYKNPQSGRRPSKSTPKTPDKTPSQTPRSSISSTVSSSSTTSTKSSTKAKNWVVQRLSKILSRDEETPTKKSGLKEFLSSL